MGKGAEIPTVATSWVDNLKQALRAAGVPIKELSVDTEWEWRQEPYEVEGPKPLNPFQTMTYRFYPTMLRWVLEDGARRLAWLPPKIHRARDVPRLDAHGMTKDFFDLILQDRRSPSPPAPE